MKSILIISTVALFNLYCKNEVNETSNIISDSTASSAEEKPAIVIIDNEPIVIDQATSSEEEKAISDKPNQKKSLESAPVAIVSLSVDESDHNQKFVPAETDAAAEGVANGNDSVNRSAANNDSKVIEAFAELAPKEAVISEVAEVKEIAGLHDAYNTLLSKYVSGSGVVDYSGLKKEEKILDQYLKDLSAQVPSVTDKTAKALAFWINAYNAYTLKLILKNWPVKSITDLNNGKPWDVKWIQLGNKSYSLNNIEHDIIRPVFNDPRIHFAVNCAAKSCPKLNNKAMTEANVDQELERLTKTFINSDQNDISSSAAKLSKIMEWYRGDFGDLVSFLNKYSTVKLGPKAKISFSEYDWSLNGN